MICSHRYAACGALLMAACTKTLPADDARDFDREAVHDAFDGVDVTRCEPPGGMVGSTHVTILIEPDGTVASAVVDDYDRESGLWMGLALRGSGAARCVERMFRAVRVAPFKPGPPVRVGQIIHFGTYMRR